jgi:hypothetical protein
MPFRRTRTLTWTAWVLALALLPFAVAEAARASQIDGSVAESAAVLQSGPAGEATYARSARPAPYVRSVSRTQAGLRDKIPSSPKPLGGAAVVAEPLPVAARTLQCAAFDVVASFVALRALGPRGPPPLKSRTT